MDTMKPKSTDTAPVIEMERCALCKKVTHERRDTPIDMRSCYEEGVGQFCRDCWAMCYYGVTK